MDSLLPNHTPTPSLYPGKENPPLESSPCNSASLHLRGTILAPTHRPWGWTCNGVFIPLEVRPEMPISYR